MSSTTEEQRLVRFEVGGKTLNAKVIRIEIFPVYDGKCSSRKAVHKWVANVSLMTKRFTRKWLSENTFML
jgi:hypothetical protein